MDTDMSSLELMTERKEKPKAKDATKLPGGGKLGKFWTHCKSRRKCRNSPYDRLLINPVLRADYCTNCNTKGV